MGSLRHTKIILIMAALAVAGLVLSVVLLTRRTSSHAYTEVPNIDTQGGVPNDETPYYAQTLKRVNRQALARAQQENRTFVPTLSDRVHMDDLDPEQLEQALKQRTQAAPLVGYNTQTDSGQIHSLPPLPPPSPGVEKQVEALVSMWDHPPNSQHLLGLQTLAESTTHPAAADSQPAGSSSSNALRTRAPTQAQKSLIHAMARYGAHLENGIDTDAPSDVLAVLDQGPCKGAQLIGNSQLTHEALSITFTTMHCQNKTVTIQALALNDQTLSSSLPASIDHRYGQRIVTPAILGALGAAGAVYGNAGNTIIHSPLGGTTEQTNPNPSIQHIAGAAAAAGLSGAQNAITQQVSAIPPIRARMQTGAAIIVQFKADVLVESL